MQLITGSRRMVEGDLLPSNLTFVHGTPLLVFATPNFVSNREEVEGQKKDQDVDARQAWRMPLGKRTITVAVIDDGVDVDPPTFARTSGGTQTRE